MSTSRTIRYSSLYPTESITRVDFSIYRNSDIPKDSTISELDGLTIAEIYNNGMPVKGGVYDRRLGVTTTYRL